MSVVKRRTLRKRIGRGILFVLGLIIILLVIEELTFFTAKPSARSTGHNAIWLRHNWVDDSHTEAQYRNLVKMFHDLDVIDVYFHAGPMRKNGAVDPDKVPGAKRLIRAIKRIDPDIRMQAWLGQVAEFGGGGPLDVRSAKTRAAVVRTAAQFLDARADGIHYDIEPIYSGDEGFIDLLRETRKVTRKHNALLSVAAYKPEEIPGTEALVRIIARCPGYWSRDYFLAVSREVDQMAVMTYDSGILLPGLFGRSVAWTVRWSHNHGIKNLMIGIPTYEEGGPAHFAQAENISTSIKGLRMGLDKVDPQNKSNVGAAIFAEWTTSPSEISEFRRMWVNPQSNKP